MRLEGKTIGILMESDFYEKEIFYYEHRFPEEGATLRFLTRLWGQPSLTFKGHEYQAPFECHESFEGLSDDELRSFDAIIVPSAFVADRLRYTEDLSKLPESDEVKQLQKDLEELGREMEKAGKATRDKIQDEVIPMIKEELERLKKRLKNFGREKEVEPLEKQLEKLTNT